VVANRRRQLVVARVAGVDYPLEAPVERIVQVVGREHATIVRRTPTRTVTFAHAAAQDFNDALREHRGCCVLGFEVC
jgi:hypothetical protein